MDGSNVSKRGNAREFWEAAVRLWSEGGLSVRQFCRQEGLTEHSFYWWRRRLASENALTESPAAGGTDAVISENRQSTVGFMPVRVLAEEVAVARHLPSRMPTSPIEISQGTGWRVCVSDGFDPTALDAVLAVLERRSC